MKKIFSIDCLKKIILGLALVCLFFCASCNTKVKNTENDDTANFYTLTFVQEGCEDIVITLMTGNCIPEKDIPLLEGKEGYDVTWSIMDFSSIQHDTVINAVYQAKQFYIFYDISTCSGASISADFSMVNYGEKYTLLTPESRSDYYVFSCWENADTGEIFENEGIYTMTEDINLTAIWINWSPPIFD